MNHLALLIPFGLPADMADDLLQQLQAPALASLAGRGRQSAASFPDEFSRTLPHERWLAEKLQPPGGAGDDSSAAWAASALRGGKLAAEAGTWFILNPAYLHIARDHLVLTDLRRLTLQEEEARALFATTQEILEESGHALLYGTAGTWFLRADGWAGLHTSTPDAACGHNVDIWLPQGEGERAWRKLLNEIQMSWHMHPVNDARTARGEAPVNGLWLWGAATLREAAGPGAPPPILFHGADDKAPLTQALAATAIADAEEALRHLQASAVPLLGVLDAVSAPALAGDWGDWLQQMQQLEQDWFAPLLAAVREGRLASLSLTLSHGSRLKTFDFNRYSLRKFWKTPSLAALAS